MSKDDNRVNFRILDPRLLRDFRTLAKARDLSEGDLAREIVCKALEGGDKTDLTLRELRNELSELKKVVRHLAEAAAVDRSRTDSPRLDDERLETEFKNIHHAIRELRRTIGTAAAAILAKAEIFSPEEATKWVENVLLAEE